MTALARLQGHTFTARPQTPEDLATGTYRYTDNMTGEVYLCRCGAWHLTKVERRR